MPLSYQAAGWPPEAEKRASFLPPCPPHLPCSPTKGDAATLWRGVGVGLCPFFSHRITQESMAHPPPRAKEEVKDFRGPQLGSDSAAWLARELIAPRGQGTEPNYIL